MFKTHELRTHRQIQDFENGEREQQTALQGWLHPEEQADHATGIAARDFF